ncbi:MAG: hypothetical protein ABWZ40_14125 [Caulobacterales bacterium]
MRLVLTAFLVAGIAGASVWALNQRPGASEAQAISPALEEALARPGCGPKPDFTLVSDRITFVKGMGNASYPGASRNAQAQAWFEYGLTLAHAFQHKDAIAAFQESQKLDAACALCVWGEAWALGPTINYKVDAGQRSAASGLLKKAAVLAADGPEQTKALIAATQKRAQSGDARAQDIAFADAMDALAAKYPKDVELAVLTADSWLIANFLWGDARGYPRALSLLEGALARRHDDVGAIHFYIHATEMAKQPAKALTEAQRLPALAPNASHLIHMPSHTYYRLGDYKKATAANENAVTVAGVYAKAIGFKGSMNGFPYFPHNLNYGLAAALISGDGQSSLDFAKGFADVYPDFDRISAWDEFEAAKYYAAQGRFADPKSVMALRQPKQPLMRALWRYARGEALYRTGDAAGVTAEIQAMRFSAGDLKAYGGSSALAQGLFDVARLSLQGRAATLEQDWPAAIESYAKAAKIEEQVLAQYKDPAMWWSGPRRYLAAAYLQAGKHAQAKQEAELTLKAWPKDPGAELVLGQAQTALGDTSKGAAALKAANESWSGAAPLSLKNM